MNIKQNFEKRKLLFSVLILFFLFSTEVYATGVKEKQFVNLTAENAYKLILANQQNENFQIIDVRTPAEFNAGHIKDSVMINFYADDFASLLQSLDKSKTYLIYCRSGSRSGRTIEMMKTMDFTKVYNLLGGIKSWRSSGLPLIK